MLNVKHSSHFKIKKMDRSILKQMTYFALSVNINHLYINEKHFQTKSLKLTLLVKGGGGCLTSRNDDGHFLGQRCIRIDDDRQSCKFMKSFL